MQGEVNIIKITVEILGEDQDLEIVGTQRKITHTDTNIIKEDVIQAI